MLKHQRQGKDECLITSIAVLMDIDREQLLDVIRERIANKPWEHYSSNERRHAISAIKFTFRDRYPAWLDVEPELHKIGNFDPAIAQFNVERFRGALIMAHEILGAHIVPFEYGMIIDTALSDPRSLNVWLSNWLPYGFRISHIFCDFDSYRSGD